MSHPLAGSLIVGPPAFGPISEEQHRCDSANGQSSNCGSGMMDVWADVLGKFSGLLPFEVHIWSLQSGQFSMISARAKKDEGVFIQRGLPCDYACFDVTAAFVQHEIRCMDIDRSCSKSQLSSLCHMFLLKPLLAIGRATLYACFKAIYVIYTVLRKVLDAPGADQATAL